MNDIAKRLNELMEERGVKASRVSAELNLSNSAFTDWKNSKNGPGVAALIKLAKYFEVSLDYLIIGKKSEADMAREEAYRREREFYDKLSVLPTFRQGMVAGYIDAMLEDANAANGWNQKTAAMENAASLAESDAYV